jgi:4-amino-4-deoxy-L-arabinose transferase-like glycosyltransferase
MFGMFISPQFIGTDGYLSMNSWEAVFWMGCTLALILMLRGRWTERWWIFFGICAGIGLLNKPSMTFFLIALGLGLLCTSQRRVLFTRWAALGIALMVLIALPNVLWQMHNHWPTLEFLRNGVKERKNVVLNPLQFFLAQFGGMHPANALIWITGVVALLRGRSIKNMRWLGLTYLFFYALMEALHAKDYYLQGIYPALFAAGGIAWEHSFANSHSVARGRIFAFPIYESIIFITGLLILPMSSPVLAPATWVRYTAAMHLHGNKLETAATGPLPQFYADRFGWNEMVTTMVTAYRSLPPGERARACIFATNYGEAGALDLLGRKMEPTLPPAIGIQNSYWMWGTHGCTFDVVIGVVDATPAEMLERYESVQLVGHLDNPYAMPFEHKNIFILRHRRATQKVVWSKFKDYI